MGNKPQSRGQGSVPLLQEQENPQSSCAITQGLAGFSAGEDQVFKDKVHFSSEHLGYGHEAVI